MDGQIFQSSSVHTYIRLDPRTKLFLLLVISTIMLSGTISGNAIYPRLALASLPFLLLLTGKKIIAAGLYALLFIAACLMEVFLVYSTTGILSIVVVMLSGLITRFIPGIVMGYYVMSTTRVSEFVASMERMHVSQKIIIPLSVMFRFFPTVVEEAHAIGDAMRMRGISFGNRGFLKNPISMLEYRMVPLMMSTVKIGDELSAASLTRGLGSPVKRTNICMIGFRVQDILLLIVASLTLIAYALL